MVILDRTTSYMVGALSQATHELLFTSRGAQCYLPASYRPRGVQCYLPIHEEHEGAILSCLVGSGLRGRRQMARGGARVVENCREKKVTTRTAFFKRCRFYRDFFVHPKDFGLMRRRPSRMPPRLRVRSITADASSLRSKTGTQNAHVMVQSFQRTPDSLVESSRSSPAGAAFGGMGGEAVNLGYYYSSVRASRRAL